MPHRRPDLRRAQADQFPRPRPPQWERCSRRPARTDILGQGNRSPPSPGAQHTGGADMNKSPARCVASWGAVRSRPAFVPRRRFGDLGLEGRSGAGSGNRTRTWSLEGSHDTISPYPRAACDPPRGADRALGDTPDIRASPAAGQDGAGQDAAGSSGSISPAPSARLELTAVPTRQAVKAAVGLGRIRRAAPGPCSPSHIAQSAGSRITGWR
jgi:hypothetical protein